MKLQHLISFNAFTFIIFGIAFGLYGPLMMALFSVSDLLQIDALEYWQVAAFARMLGGILLGFGLLLWAVRGILKQINQESRNGIVFALFLSSLITVIISITQQSLIWQSIAGWISTGLFLFLTFAYGYFLFQMQKKRR